MKKTSATMAFESRTLLSELLVQNYFWHDMNLYLEFSMVIFFWKIKSQSLNFSLPSSFDPDPVNITINNVR